MVDYIVDAVREGALPPDRNELLEYLIEDSGKFISQEGNV
jgi:hypothetical protein